MIQNKKCSFRTATALAILFILGLFLASACVHPESGLASKGNNRNNNMPGKGGPGGNGGPGGPPPQGTPPDGFGGPGGTPPSGAPGGTGGTGGPGQQSPVNICASLTVSGDTRAESGKTFTANAADTSAVWVTKSGTLTLADALINKTGNTSNEDNSNFAGQNAAALANEGGHLILKNTTINTNGDGANAVVSTGKTSVVDIDGLSIQTKANSSRGLHATWGGTIRANNVTIDTSGEHCAGLATDRGEGTVSASLAKVHTSGAGSPGIYSTGAISASKSTFVATGSEAAVIEGKNSITLVDSSIYGAKQWGVMLYQSFSGDAGVGTSSFTMTRGSIAAATGPLFYITNTNAVVRLEGVALKQNSGTLISAATGRWGTAGSNGGNLTLTALGQELEGNVEADSISSVTLILQQGSSLSGSLRNASLTLDESSTWNLTADSSVNYLAQNGTSGENMLKNIKSNGHRITYNASLEQNAWLGGKTMELPGGGTLSPRL